MSEAAPSGERGARKPRSSPIEADNTSMETRRIMRRGRPISVRRDGDDLVAVDGERLTIADAQHLPPCEPTKIVCVHLNYESRRAEFQTSLGTAPTYFHKPVSALNHHEGEVVRPPP